jgi:tetraacyldisaccharide 4'-kinase
MGERTIERRWESTSLASRAVRAALTPASWLYGGVIGLRNQLYERRILSVHPLGLPTISVGNLTVGGTGKTPIASWFAQEILSAGGKPAILLRGYGGDEVKVHEFLAPDALVIAGADRVATAARARTLGATALVLDDAFQHRRAGRDADVVLLSADRHRQVRLLPAGPWREPFDSLRRATHVIVTRKRTTPLHAKELLAYATRMAPHAEGAIAHLAADALVQWGGPGRRALDALAGRTVLAISGIGDPRAFEAQLRGASARIAMRAFRDHHAFSAADTGRLSAPPLWYLSQRVSIEVGAEALQGLARRLARPATI